MARIVRDARLETRTARLKLPPQHEPYWKAIDAGRHVGYRRGVRKASWLVRYRTDEGKYRKAVLGLADDTEDGDNASVLSYSQAQEKARKWFTEAVREASGETIHVGPYTVADAACDYLDWFRNHRKSMQDVEYSINGHILPAFGKLEVSKLTAVKLRKWHAGLAETAARLRTRQGREQNYRETNGDPEEQRKRRATANRVLTVLKALLNHAWHEGKVADDHAWRRVKPFKGADAARVRYLTSDECIRLINACDADLRRLVQAALLTGCRYGELARLVVSDYNPDAGTILVQEAKSGKPRHVVLAEDGQAFFEDITVGRPGDATMLTRNGGSKWGRAHQQRPVREACERAKIRPAVSFHILRHTYASHLVMNGAPLQVAAHNLGHADIRMVEKHYALLQPSWVADAIRAAAPKLGIVSKSKVVKIRRG